MRLTILPSLALASDEIASAIVHCRRNLSALGTFALQETPESLSAAAQTLAEFGTLLEGLNSRTGRRLGIRSGITWNGTEHPNMGHSSELLKGYPHGIAPSAFPHCSPLHKKLHQTQKKGGLPITTNIGPKIGAMHSSFVTKGFMRRWPGPFSSGSGR